MPASRARSKCFPHGGHRALVRLDGSVGDVFCHDAPPALTFFVAAYEGPGARFRMPESRSRHGFGGLACCARQAPRPRPDRATDRGRPGSRVVRCSPSVEPHYRRNGRASTPPIVLFHGGRPPDTRRAFVSNGTWGATAGCRGPCRRRRRSTVLPRRAPSAECAARLSGPVMLRGGFGRECWCLALRSPPRWALQIHVRVDASELGGLTQRVEERGDLSAADRLRPVVILRPPTGLTRRGERSSGRNRQSGRRYVARRDSH